MRTTVAVAKRLGFKSSILLRTPTGQKPSPENYDGNLFFTHLLADNVRFCSAEEYKNRATLMEEMQKQISSNASDQKAYIIPEGGSNATGMWGYISMMKELHSENRKFTTIVVPVGSGGTIAGVLAGKALLKMDVHVIGIAVCDSAAFFRAEVDKLFKEFNEKFSTSLQPGSYDLYEDYIGDGYAQTYELELQLVKTIIQSQGIFLDLSYGGKAMVGITDLIIKRKFKPTDSILFVHTGGIWSLFAEKKQLV